VNKKVEELEKCARAQTEILLNLIKELENRIKELENHNINNIIKRVEKLERDIISNDKYNKFIIEEVAQEIPDINQDTDITDKLNDRCDDLEAKNYQLKSDFDNNNKRLEELEDWHNDNKIKALKNHNNELSCIHKHHDDLAELVDTHTSQINNIMNKVNNINLNKGGE
jgi:chromosome segregation ATPase